MNLITGNITPDASASRPSSISRLLLSLAFLAGAPAAAQAHDIYSGLVSTYGTACCDDSDCRPAPYKVTPAGVQMHINRKWISVPATAIQYRILSGDKGETAGGHWCGGQWVLHILRLPASNLCGQPPLTTRNNHSRAALYADPLAASARRGLAFMQPCACAPFPGRSAPRAYR
jgi:hypothetical protein